MDNDAGFQKFKMYQDPATAISLHQIIFLFEINTLHTYKVLSKMAWVWLTTCTLA
jgi:hypothetical protein